MEFLYIKEAVVAAGKRLLKSGLTARTWGNVSARVDDFSFAVTPSGVPYEAITAEDIVIVSIETLQYSNNLRPSSESAVHALLYKYYPSVNFIIHTHQMFASVISTMRNSLNITSDEYRRFLGGKIPIADYALAGTKKIAENVYKTLCTCPSKAVLMAKHGVLCFGESSEEVFNIAHLLEDYSRYFIATHFLCLPNDANYSPLPLINFYASRREDGFCVVYNLKTGDVISKTLIYTDSTGENCGTFYTDIHRKIYSERSDINYIIQSTAPYTFYVSDSIEQQKNIEPFLDDAAQILGIDIKLCSPVSNVEKTSNLIVKLLKNRNSVLIAKCGALCCGGTLQDAEAVKLILEKNMLAFLLSLHDNTIKPLSPNTASMLRKSYNTSYSKIAR